MGIATAATIFVFASPLYARPRHQFLPILSGPWQSADAAIVLDPYHSNQYTIADLRLDPRIVGIIHKASERRPTVSLWIRPIQIDAARP